MMEFILVNGKIERAAEVNISHLFFDAPFTFSQKIWYGYGGIPMFAENIKNIQKQLGIFQCKIPALILNQRELFRLSKRLLNKNKLYRSGYLVFQFLILKKKVNFLVSCEAFETFDFPLSKRGILLNFSSSLKFSETPGAQFGLFNSAFWKQLNAKNVNSIFDNSIIFNEQQAVCETLDSNIFLISDKLIITPSDESGCYIDLLRKVAIDAAFELGFKIIESAKIHKKDILHAQEIFLVSEKKGIEWVVGVENKRFIHEKVHDIHRQINHQLKAKAK